MKNKLALLLFSVACMGFWVYGSAQAEEATEIYENGKEAYTRDDHLNAVKYLFAYLALVGKGVKPEVKKEISDAVAYSEKHINVALETKRQLDRYGQVVKITVDASGAADRWEPILRDIPYTPPSAGTGFKPSVPSAEEIESSKPIHVKPIPVYKLKSQEEDQCAKKYEKLAAEYESLKEKYGAIEHVYSTQCERAVHEYKRLKAKYEELKQAYNSLERQEAPSENQ